METCDLVVVRMMLNDYPKRILSTCDTVVCLRSRGLNAIANDRCHAAFGIETGKG